MNRIVINGNEFIIDGGNITVNNNEVIVNGQKLESLNNYESKQIDISVHGHCESLDCGGSVTVHGSVVDVDCGGSVYCYGNVGGDIDCGGSVVIKQVSTDNCMKLIEKIEQSLYEHINSCEAEADGTVNDQKCRIAILHDKSLLKIIQDFKRDELNVKKD